MRDFQYKLKESLGNTYSIRVGKILSEEEVEKLIKYIRIKNNDPDATVEIIQPVGYEEPDFDFEIISVNDEPITSNNESNSLIKLNTENKVSKIYGENWVVLQNRLLNAISDLNRDERRLIMFLSPIVRNAVDKNPNQKLFKIYAKDFAKEYDITEKHVYERLKNISESIHGKVFYYWNFKENKRTNRVGVSWIGTAEYKSSEGMVEVLLLDEVITMLTVFDKSNPFTKYERKHIANLGCYGIILFELMASCMHLKYKTKSYEIEFLREKFNCTETYLLTAEFRRNVLEKAIADIQKNTPYKIDHKVKKVGRKVSEIVFKFEYESKKLSDSDKDKIENGQVTNLLPWQKNGLTDSQINKIAIYAEEFTIANSKFMSPNFRGGYRELIDSWRPLLKDPEKVKGFQRIQELLDRSAN